MIRTRRSDLRALARIARHRDLDTLRAAAWTLRAVRDARRSMRTGGLDGLALPAVPPLSPAARRGVDGTLRRTGASCLEQAVVRQAWAASQGEHRDVVVGVSSPRDFGAHAWLDGDPPAASDGFHEILRRRAPAAGTG